MNLNEIKITKKHIIIAVLAIFVFYASSLFFINYLRIEVKKGAFRQHDIDSFAGCFGEGKESYTSYEKMTEQEIEESIKKLDISRKEFEKRKDECTKDSQIMSFAGCEETDHKWKKWNEMSDKEFNDNLKYFDIDRKLFDHFRNGCENGNWE